MTYKIPKINPLKLLCIVLENYFKSKTHVKIAFIYFDLQVHEWLSNYLF